VKVLIKTKSSAAGCNSALDKCSSPFSSMTKRISRTQRHSIGSGHNREKKKQSFLRLKRKEGGKIYDIEDKLHCIERSKGM